jgi:hypothetical protein
LKHFISIFLIAISATTLAQTPVVADSSLINQQRLQYFKAASWGMNQLVISEFEKISFAGLTYGHQQGHFRTAQQAEQTNSVTFDAQGISRINRFKLYGYFSFNRKWQDSLAFSQKGIEDDFTPYYYIAQKAGTFERQQYSGGGIISYNLIKDKLFLGTGIDYLYHTSARSVDPRSMVTTFRLKLNPSVSYKTGNQIIGAGVTAGYGDENVTIDYKNKDFRGTLHPERISYLNYGYGYLYMDDERIIRKNNYTGINLDYAIKKINWDLQSSIRYLISKEVNQYPKEKSINNEVFGIFQLETYSLSILFNRKSNKVSDQFLLHISQDNGDDKLVHLAARNYTYQSTKINASYSHYKYRPNNPSFSYFALLNYRDVYQRDAAADHTASYTYFQPKVGATLNFQNVNKSLFSMQLALGARLPLQNEIRIPSTQLYSFAYGVVVPDNLYWSSEVGEVEISFNYITSKLINKFRTGFELNSIYLRNLAMPTTTLDATFIPGNYNLSFNCALKLYF